MKTYIYHLFIWSAILATSCKNELPFDIQENPPKLVMNAMMNADSLTNVLLLNFTGREHTTHVEAARVEVHVNGKLKESLQPIPRKEGDRQCRFKLTSKFTPGDVVRIDAFTDDGKHHAWAEVTVPQPLARIEKVDTLTIPLKEYSHTENHMRYKITFTDLPGEKNYYRLIIDKRSTWTYEIYDHDNNGVRKSVDKTYHSYKFISREDVVLTDGHPSTNEESENGMFDTSENNYAIFDDSRFQNSSYTMTVYNRAGPDHFYSESGKIIGYKVDALIRLLSITETEYYYLKALNLLDSDSHDETISEPIKLPSNVHGGTGIVGICTQVSKVLPISEHHY